MKRITYGKKLNNIVKRRILKYDVEVDCGNIDMCGYSGRMVEKEETDKEYRYACPECGRINMTLRKGINDDSSRSNPTNR